MRSVSHRLASRSPSPPPRSRGRASALPPAAPASAVPSFEDPRIHEIVATPSRPQRIESDVPHARGLRHPAHPLRHPLAPRAASAPRGAGCSTSSSASRRRAAGAWRCATSRAIVPGDPRAASAGHQDRERGRRSTAAAPTRTATSLHTGDIDSRVSDVMNATSDNPGANDNASGMAAVLEAARVLSRYPSDGHHRLRRPLRRGAGALRRRDPGRLGRKQGMADRGRDQQRHGGQLPRDHGGDGQHHRARLRAGAAPRRHRGGAEPDPAHRRRAGHPGAAARALHRPRRPTCTSPTSTC